MLGQMQHWSLTLDKIITHAGEQQASQSVFWQDQDGEPQQTNYDHALKLSKTFSAALVNFGIRPHERVGSLMWNNIEHLVAWYGTMGIGVVLHTLNPRLHANQIAWIAGHGGARLLVAEEDFLPILREVADRLPLVEYIIISTKKHIIAPIGNKITMTLEQFLASAGPVPQWGCFAEDTAAGLCYTSGTTGDPKGVLYSHRSNFLHALSVNQPNGFGVESSDVVMPIVPMFHANAWALIFVAPMAGAGLVLPGRHLDGASLHRMIEHCGVTFAVGVPTVWQDLLRYLRISGKQIKSLKRVMIGGAAASREIVEQLRADHGVEVIQGWGMTEMSPIGSVSKAGPVKDATLQSDDTGQILRQGRALFPVEAAVFGADGAPCLRDDKSAGALKVRGPTVVDTYFGAANSVLDAEGWFDTGDIAVMDSEGSIRLVDRAKDIVKSGGEWISSMELENLAVTHPGVRRAAVIALPDEKWGERPLLVIEAVGTEEPTPQELIEHLRPSVPKWWLPSHIAYCALPLGATGKLDKMALRRLMASPEAPALKTP
jgi:fatty-acyl-CoA synthase